MDDKKERLLPIFETSAKIVYNIDSKSLGDVMKRLIHDYFITDEVKAEAVFEPLTESLFDLLYRDACNYERYCKRQSDNRKKRKATTTQPTDNQSVTTAQPNSDQSTTTTQPTDNQNEVNNNINNNININDNNNINDNINNNINDNYISSLSGKPDSAPDPRADTVTEIIGYLNLRTGKNYSPKSKANIEHIHARLDEGYSIEDFKQAIDNEAAKWMGTDMEKYLRPSTLFNKEKFDGYVNDTYNEPTKSKKQTIYEHNTQMLDGWTNTDEAFDADEITPIEALPF